MQNEQARPRLAITIGDINGIGPEILLKALGNPNVQSACEPIVVGRSDAIVATASLLRIGGVERTDYGVRINGYDVRVVEVGVNILPRPGEIDARSGRLAGQAITRGAEMVLNGEAEGLVTMPISKKAFNAGGFEYPGHTEMLASIAGGEPLMILISPTLRVAIVTIHTPLRNVPGMLTWDLLERRIRALHASLRQDFLIPQPKIAVLGLNPHAGEHGLIGREEVEVISPTIERLRLEIPDLDGPHPADGFFARWAPGEYDAVLAMYHDQGLIPLKMTARGAGVNVTAGLSIVRSSPDHGTAFNIAGLGIADEHSTVQSILMAASIVSNRHATAPDADRFGTR